MFVLWVACNLPTMADLKWMMQGGGLFTKGSHAPAYKFNAGQKILFWFLILGGLSVSFSGLCLLMPFTLHAFAPAFVLDIFGATCLPIFLHWKRRSSPSSGTPLSLCC